MPALEFAGQPGGWLCLRAKALGLAEGDAMGGAVEAEQLAFQ